MYIFGIDPGLATIGFAVINLEENSLQLLDYGIITTNSKTPKYQRFIQISEDIVLLLNKYKPEIVGIEKLFFNTNQKTAMVVAESRGLCINEILKITDNIIEFTPLQVKSYVTGFGQAKKNQIQESIKQIFKLKNIPKPDDAADAIAIAYCATILTKNKSKYKS